MAIAAHIEKARIHDHMPVVGSDGKPAGTVDHLAGDYVRMSRTDATAGGIHRYLPLTAIAGLEGGVVRLSMPAAQVRQACLTEPELRERVSLNLNDAARVGRPTAEAPHGGRAQDERQHGAGGPTSGPGGHLSVATRNTG